MYRSGAIAFALPIYLRSVANRRDHWAKSHARSSEQRMVTAANVRREPVRSYALERLKRKRLVVVLTRVRPRGRTPLDAIQAAVGHQVIHVIEGMPR